MVGFRHCPAQAKLLLGSIFRYLGMLIYVVVDLRVPTPVPSLIVQEEWVDVHSLMFKPGYVVVFISSIQKLSLNALLVSLFDLFSSMPFIVKCEMLWFGR